MTPLQLLQPRYKVIGPYPFSKFKVGQILLLNEYDGREHLSQQEYFLIHEDGICYHESFLRDYPHLFRPLQWYEERKVEDMPEYVKWEYDTDDVGKIEKVTRWRLLHNDLMADVPSVLNSVLAECFLPATEEEYNNYINSK